MAYENIILRRQNVTMVDGYFYMFDEDTDSLIVKTDDGTQSYSYPLDTVLANEIKSLEFDGVNFWTLEDSGTNDVTIRRWYIDNYICKQRQSIDLVETGSDKFQSEAFTVEHYATTFSTGESTPISVIGATDSSKVDSGMTVFLGPSTAVGYEGATEEITVSSATASTISLNDPISSDYAAGDPILFYTTIWLFNDFHGLDGGTGALYEIEPISESIVNRNAGGGYQDVQAATFFDVPYYVFNGGVSETPKDNSIIYVKTTNAIFLDPEDLDTPFGSMSMDNVEDNQATVIPIYDLTLYGTNVYRLQTKATYYGTTYSWSSYNYQLSTLNAFITSISLRAEPAILPADTVSTAAITAVVKDQFGQAINGRRVDFTDDDSVGDVAPDFDNTDASGEASTVYTAGDTAREVTITATAQQT